MVQKITPAEATVAVLAGPFLENEGWSVWNPVTQVETAKPTVSQVQMYLFAQSPFRSDAKAIPHQQHPNEQLRVNGWATSLAVEIGQVRQDAHSASTKRSINCNR
jgi:hypothetical protein